jgi:hypothetical protein
LHRFDHTVEGLTAMSAATSSIASAQLYRIPVFFPSRYGVDGTARILSSLSTL